MFYKNSASWISELKSEFKIIREELNQFLASNTSDISAQYSEYTTKGQWKTIPLVFFTIPNKTVLEFFPKTKLFLDTIPELIGAEFSMLDSYTIISPHVGYSKQIMRTHLGLEIPEGDLGLRCNEEEVTWREGETFSFNDGMKHEAWNNSGKPRWILMVDTPVPKSKYSGDEIASYKINNLNDEKLLKIASREQWVKWLNE